MKQKPLLQICFDELLYKGLVSSQSDFANKIGKTKGYVSKLLSSEDILPPGVREKISEVFGISAAYLSTNGKEGAMFGDIPEPEKPKRRIPMMGEGVAGGDMELNVTEDNGYVGEYIDIGDLLKDSEAAFTVYGNSTEIYFKIQNKRLDEAMSKWDE